MNRGIFYGIGAYGLWGLLPIYWKLLQEIPASEVLVHRMIWSLVFLVLLLTIRRQWVWVQRARHDKDTLIYLTVAALLLSLNWYTYIWAVNTGFIVEASLGYFITPLLNVALGVLLLRERLRFGQWLAVGLAALGVLYLTLSYGALPWIALTLASTFALYGYIKKKVRLDALQSLTAEMALLFIPATLFLVLQEWQHSAVFAHASLGTNLLLLSTGVVTAIPLLLFAGAAQRIPLTTIGLLQYIAPTLQFLLGIFLYHEAFSISRLLGFSIIWLALLIYTTDNARHYRDSRPLPRSG